YYMYQSEWTDEPVLHVFPHWTWTDREEVDIWAYYSQADEVELFLNGRSLGKASKEGEELHVMWRVPYEPGELKAVSYRDGREVLTQTLRTAGEAAAVGLVSDRETLTFDDRELAFITVTIEDEHGTLLPDADHTVTFTVEGAGRLKAVGNGNQTSHESFLADHRQAFHGKCLLIVEPTAAGTIQITASSPGLTSKTIQLTSR
ncbi:MAG: DUF4982 domain-containing protein, partial [Lewinella sp.]|nr:DUF4982 domain-containing protein [Lewinella sp.]